MGKKEKNMQEQAVQEQAVQELAVIAEAKTEDVISSLMKAVPSIVDNEGKRTYAVQVGEAVIKDITTAKTIVTTRTIAKFNAVSAIMGAIEMGAVTKEKAKAEGFTTVYRMFECAIPSLSDSRIRELYTVGRLFGDITTHEWRKPIPSKASITNLSAIAKYFNMGKKIDEASPADIAERFAYIVQECIDCEEPLPLDGTLSELRKALKERENTIKGEFTESNSNVPADNEGQEQEQEQEQEQAKPTEDRTVGAREAVNYLFDYFKDNEAVKQALYTILENMPKEQEQEQEQEQ